jgi:hypothetical protein
LHQCVSFLLILLLSSLDNLPTQIGNLAVRLDLRLMATDTANNVLCVRLQLGNILLFTLRTQRHGEAYQTRNYQQPIHKFDGATEPLKLPFRTAPPFDR